MIMNDDGGGGDDDHDILFIYNDCIYLHAYVGERVVNTVHDYQ